MEKNSDEARQKQKPASVQFSDQQVNEVENEAFRRTRRRRRRCGWFDCPYLIAGGFKERASATSRQISSWHHNTRRESFTIQAGPKAHDTPLYPERARKMAGLVAGGYLQSAEIWKASGPR
jgi:hypothetical protein